jgi:hypothetical protein
MLLLAKPGRSPDSPSAFRLPACVSVGPGWQPPGLHDSQFGFRLPAGCGPGFPPGL